MFINITRLVVGELRLMIGLKEDFLQCPNIHLENLQHIARKRNGKSIYVLELKRLGGQEVAT